MYECQKQKNKVSFPRANLKIKMEKIRLILYITLLADYHTLADF